ncbi:hypothetical protein FB451DRAFT_1190378 [Mycena latifolia]|nr:hypothetical protein FB451DRAFT_1190378 [Mycena latifolia]
MPSNQLETLTEHSDPWDIASNTRFETYQAHQGLQRSCAQEILLQTPRLTSAEQLQQLETSAKCSWTHGILLQTPGLRWKQWILLQTPGVRPVKQIEGLNIATCMGKLLQTPGLRPAKHIKGFNIPAPSLRPQQNECSSPGLAWWVSNLVSEAVFHACRNVQLRFEVAWQISNLVSLKRRKSRKASKSPARPCIAQWQTIHLSEPEEVLEVTAEVGPRTRIDDMQWVAELLHRVDHVEDGAEVVINNLFKRLLDITKWYGWVADSLREMREMDGHSSEWPTGFQLVDDRVEKPAEGSSVEKPAEGSIFPNFKYNIQYSTLSCLSQVRSSPLKVHKVWQKTTSTKISGVRSIPRLIPTQSQNRSGAPARAA